jgi:dTDP-4-amino-4,6-dideoxygalactose transaminase
MLTTSDPELDRKFRLLRQHGMSVPDTVRHGAKSVIFEAYPIVGFNYRMTDIQAAVGRVQLARLEDILARRIRLAERYTVALGQISGLEPPASPWYARSNFQSYPVRVTPAYPLSRDELMQRLLDRGISTRRGIMNAHQEGAYADGPNRKLACSEASRDQVLLLPLYPILSEIDQEFIIGSLADIRVSLGGKDRDAVTRRN